MPTQVQCTCYLIMYQTWLQAISDQNNPLKEYAAFCLKVNIACRTCTLAAKCESFQKFSESNSL